MDFQNGGQMQIGPPHGPVFNVPGGRVTVYACQFDVSDVKSYSPLAIIGRLMGGCEICGTLKPRRYFLQITQATDSNHKVQRVCDECEDAHPAIFRGDFGPEGRKPGQFVDIQTEQDQGANHCLLSLLTKSANWSSGESATSARKPERSSSWTSLGVPPTKSCYAGLKLSRMTFAACSTTTT